MTRRTFIASTSALSLVCLWPFRADRRTYGLVDVELFTALKLKECRLDGENITARCFAADDRYGWAAVYRAHPVSGKLFVAGLDPAVPLRPGDRVGEIAVEVLHGRVAFA